MPIRYRKLITRPDLQAQASIALDRARRRRDAFLEESGPNLEAPDSGGPAPVAVESQDGEAEEWEVEALLNRGDLQPTDLVDLGKGWEPLGECLRFMEVCEELERRRKARARVYGGAAVALAVVAVVLFVLLSGR